MEQVQSKFSISLKPPLPNTRSINSPRSPNIPLSPTSLPIKRTSNSKTIHRGSIEKSRKEVQIQKEIKYTKNVKQEPKTQPSFIQSETNTFAMPANHKLEESQSTVQRVKSNSRQKGQGSHWRRPELTEHTDRKMLESISGVSHTSPNRKGSSEKNEEFYLYWKNKAHQYLQQNMKLLDQISKITKENSDLKDVIQKLKSNNSKELNDNKQPQSPSLKAFEVDKSFLDLRIMSIHYLNKIEDMQKELKRKEVIIVSYQTKTKQLSQALVGDRERISINAKLKEQILTLKQENRILRLQTAQISPQNRIQNSGNKLKSQKSVHIRNT